MMIVALWSFAVFLASVFAAVLVSRTLTPKLKKPLMILGWIAAGIVGYGVAFLSYTINLTNDLVGIIGLTAIVCVTTQLLYKESWSSKLFTALMAGLIANVVTFMFCGTTDTFLGAKLGAFTAESGPYTVNNLLLFIGIKVVVYIIFFVLYMLLLKRHVTQIIETLGGKMQPYLVAPAISVIGFYVLNLISNATGIFPGTAYFFPLYVTVCVIFVVEYYQIFSSVAWSARAMKNEAELNVAANIQQDMLPSIFPAFPDRDEFDIYASMNPAKEVGGDFYDFFLIDEDHLGMVIADVSGKGVPAALFMVISKTLLKNAAMLGLAPHEVLEQVNNQLCENNQENMFTTAWFGVMEISTGKVVASNAGHEYPAIRKANGQFELIMDRHGMVLGAMEGLRHRDYEFEIEKGGTLYVYTDGVPEATNTHFQLFETDRLLEALNINPDGAPQELLKNVANSIDVFVGGADQFDDITMLCIKRK